MKITLIYQVSKKSKHYKYTEDPTELVKVDYPIIKFANYRRKYDSMPYVAVQTGWGIPIRIFWRGRHMHKQTPIITKYFMEPDDAFRVMAHYYALKGKAILCQ